MSSLARQFGVNRTTFYRHYSDIVTAMLDAAAKNTMPNGPAAAVHSPTMTRLNRLCNGYVENTDLRKHVRNLRTHIRMLTMENQRLREQIETTTGVTRD